MSVAELTPRGGEFERTPPHDLAAEQCVLGGMLMSKDAISDVMEVISPLDHYRPAHQLVHEAILELYGRGEPADPVTVSDLLAKRGELARIGGGAYLHTLLASVPTAANAGYYARIVRERAILRRLVEAGTRIVQLGYAGDGDADELVDRAEAEIYGVTERRVSEDYLPLADIMPGALDEIEAIGSRGGVMTGVPTGFNDLDSLTNGLHAGQMVVIAARPAIGKALALDTPLPTPTGWTTMAEVAVGEQLLGSDGRPVTVVAATEAMHGRPCYEVEFSDGEVIVADAQHQWLTWTRRARRYDAQTRGHAREFAKPVPPEVVTTEQIARTLRCPTVDHRPNHAVSVSQPLDLPEADLPIPSYALGVWLSGGASASAAFTTVDPEIIIHVEAAGLVAVPHGTRYRYRMAFPDTCRGTVRAMLRTLGVLGNKHIPLSYLRGSEAQRRALLAGILDTDGTVTSTGYIQLAVTNRELAEGVRELVASLGYRCSMSTKRVKGRSEASSTCYMVNFTTPDRVFWLDRKHLLHKERLRHRPQRTRWRYIVDVRPVPSRPVRCVQVDSADRLYLAGRSMIPTHNSTLALDLARAASLKHGLTTVMFSLEMSRNEITMRLLSAESRVPLHAMRTGQMGEEDWTRLARRMSEVVDAPLFIDDSPNMSLMEIRAKCRRLKQRHNLRLVIVDYLQLMSSPRRVENRQQEVSEMSRSLKLLAKELDVPVIAISQLNRGPEQRNDKRPLLSDLRESGCLTAQTRVLRADTGTQVTLGSLLASGERDVPVWALDERLRLIARPMTHVFPTGVKEVFRVRLASGRQVEATGNHPFLTYDGWRPLTEIPAGTRVAVPRHVPAPLELRDMPEAEITMLAHHLGDGLRSHEKFVPDPVFALPKKRLSLFLRHLWATDGCVWWDEKVGQARIYYASTSRRLIDDVAQLLMRFNVMTRIKETKKGNYRPCYHLLVYGAENQLRFLDDIGVHGARSVMAERARANLVAIKGNTNLDTVPREIWDRVRGVLVERHMTHREFAAAIGTQFCGSTLWRHAPSRERLARIASVLDDADLEMIATNDVFWDEIASVESLGMQPVYDATVAGAHNFVANGINVHNSIEQDSDVVILLHREDAYEPESPRAGEADLIVAKHRNGPTAVVTVAFQGHYSRFVDMAPG
jgi:replicative DNA helicase